MPRKNTERFYLKESFYHIYNRGVNKEPIFREQRDYAVFINLFKRYLGSLPVKDNQGREYPWLHKDIDLLAFCLLSNHFHALVLQQSADAVSRLFGAITTSYGMYFNKKYNRVGPVFQSRFKSSKINNDTYLHHISRYIHLNPQNHIDYEFSSLPYYLGFKSADWINPEPILQLFNSEGEYKKFVDDYASYKDTLDEIRAELASA